MQINEFIFSNKPIYRYTRHLVFWMIYGTYYWLQSLVPTTIDDFTHFQVYTNALFSLICFLPTCIMSVYISLYVISPGYIFKERYFKAMVLVLLLFAIDFVINYLLSYVFFDHIDFKYSLVKNNHSTHIILTLYNSVYAILISIVAMGIKFCKNWYLQQQKNIKIIQQKQRAQLRSQKASLQPAYLSTSLKNLSNQILEDQPEAPGTVLKLADLLSYWLYESDQMMVPVQHEIAAIKNYISVEQLNSGQHLQITFDHKDINENDLVPPMLILGLLQDCIMMLKAKDIRLLVMDLLLTSESEKLVANLRITHVACAEIGENITSDLIDKTGKKLGILLMQDEFKINWTTTQSEFLITITLYLGRYITSFHQARTQPAKGGGFYEPAHSDIHQ